MSGPALDLTGQRFNRLVAIERIENAGRGVPRWRCQCDCGGTAIVRAGHLTAGKVKSCGCQNLSSLLRRIGAASPEAVVGMVAVLPKSPSASKPKSDSQGARKPAVFKTKGARDRYTRMRNAVARARQAIAEADALDDHNGHADHQGFPETYRPPLAAAAIEAMADQPQQKEVA
jgi:hypothetical protein